MLFYKSFRETSDKTNKTHLPSWTFKAKASSWYYSYKLMIPKTKMNLADSGYLLLFAKNVYWIVYRENGNQ